MEKNLNQLCINTIRTLAMDAVQAANSGHPGAPMAMAPVAFTLYDRFLKFNPSEPFWPGRDRFILSAGHASMLLYGTLHIMGFEVTLDDIRAFRQLHSKCPGHPEYGLTPGVETTTGPLAQGAATSVGFAIAGKWLAARYNRPGFPVFDNKIYSLTGDGCMMEGLSGEAASLAGHLGLDNLIWIYDSNRITIEGATRLAFSEDVGARFIAYGWDVRHVSDANDTEMLAEAIRGISTDKPVLIIVESHIAYGAPTKQDTHGAHGAPLGEEEIRGAKQFYGWDPEKKFHVPDEVKQYRERIITRGREMQEAWDRMFAQYRAEYPGLAAEIDLILKRELPPEWDCCLPAFEAGTKISGRSASSKVLNAIAGSIPFMIGGSADLSPSTLTDLKNEQSFQRSNYSGRNLHYGIREQAMGAIANGITLSGLKTFASTFLVFSDYLRSSLRLSALMNLPVIYIFTHDSIGVGEDGPTHQPVEHLASLRAIPNLEVIRPGDANEVTVLWRYIMTLSRNPVALVLSRQDLPVIDRTRYAPAEGALKGGYVLAGSEGVPEVILIATGSEVHLALEAFEMLKEEGTRARVVSMPVRSLFERQTLDYRNSVLPGNVTARISIEAASTFGWSEYAGSEGRGKNIGMKTFGASGTLKSLFEEFGLTARLIADQAKSIINSSNT